MTRFLDELGQMPDALRALVGHYRGDGGRQALQQWRRIIGGGDRRRVAFVGMGTSRFAGLVAARALARAGIACEGVDAGEWLHDGRPTVAAEQVVAVSQSGRSAEVVALLERDALPRPLVGVTNDLRSPLAARADLALPLHAGDEAAISTKSYANTLALCWLMGVAVGDGEGVSAALDALDAAACALEQVEEPAIHAAADRLTGIEQLAFVGRGPALVAARQAALTFSEGTRLLALSFSGGAFRHGPIECCGPQLGLVIFAPAGGTQPLMLRLADEAASHGTRVALFADRLPAGAPPDPRVIPVAQPELPAAFADRAEELFPLLAARAQNHLLYAVAAGRGIEAGRFRYGSKITDRQ